MKKQKQLKVIDLFAGVGGFRVGLERANKILGKNTYRFVWGNQWEPGLKKQDAADIYRVKFDVDESEFSNEDINNVPTQIIPNHDLMVAGFPCQDYSVATTKKLSGGINGRKGVLWWQLERILREKGEQSPDYFIFENVDRLLSSPASQRGRDFAIMLACLNNLRYAVEWRVINAADYGFPQRRKRVFFIGYKEGTKPYSQFPINKEEAIGWLNQEGIFAGAFPIQKIEIQSIKTIKLHNVKKGADWNEKNLLVKHISDNFNKNGKITPFMKSGIMKSGVIYTSNILPRYNGKTSTLGDILLDEKDVPLEFFITEKDLEKWKYLKGAKKEERTSSSTGHKYYYSEGAITYPDALDKPSRTIITGEGGRGPSRFKHVVKSKDGRLRRLTPIELERLDMFDDNHTYIEGITDSRRAFIMGNALVVGVVQRIGEFLAKKL